MKQLTKDTRITLLMGGPGSEHEVSLNSGKGVAEALSSAGFTQVSTLIVHDEVPTIPEGTELCYNMIHGTYGEDGGLQSYLEAMNMPYTGAGSKVSHECFDKVLTKKQFFAKGVSTPADQIMTRAEIAAGIKPSISLPLVVKPPKEGSSFGVHIVTEQAQLDAALNDVASYGEEILVEEFIAGKELTVPILDGIALPIVHICPRSGFYDVNNKYPSIYGKGGTDYICPANLSEEQTKAVQQAAVDAYQALGVQVYGRVDVLLTEEGKPYVLEINTIPGMTGSSLFPKSAAAAGISYAELCTRIAEISLHLDRSC
ncbi:MAG: D-alanine--D-alanine ligase [Akkermansia sp.]